MQLAFVTVADPGTEPDPRRAVIGCYLQMLEVAARHGPERRDSETPTEYLRRMLASTAATATPATSLTRLFDRARYSQQHRSGNRCLRRWRGWHRRHRRYGRR